MLQCSCLLAVLKATNFNVFHWTIFRWARVICIEQNQTPRSFVEPIQRYSKAKTNVTIYLGLFYSLCFRSLVFIKLSFESNTVQFEVVTMGTRKKLTRRPFKIQMRKAWGTKSVYTYLESELAKDSGRYWPLIPTCILHYTIYCGSEEISNHQVHNSSHYRPKFKKSKIRK